MRSNLMKREKIEPKETDEEEWKPQGQSPGGATKNVSRAAQRKHGGLMCTARLRHENRSRGTARRRHRSLSLHVFIFPEIHQASLTSVIRGRPLRYTSTPHVATDMHPHAHTHTPARQTDTMRQRTCSLALSGSLASTLAHLVRKSWNDLFISSQLKLQEQEHFNGNINIKWS